MLERPSFLQRNWIWIVVAIISAAVILWSMYMWLDFIIIQTMYTAKASLNWFQISFYYNYTFIFAALLALLTVNPLWGRSDLYEAFNGFQQLAKLRSPMTPAPPPLPFQFPTIKLKRTRSTWLMWQLFKWAVAFSVIVTAQEIPYIGPFVTVFYMMLKGFGSWSQVPRVFMMALQPASSAELIALMPTLEVQYRFLFIVLLSVTGVIVVRLVLKALRDFFYGKETTWIRNIFVSLTLGVFAFLFDAPYWRMDATTPYFYYIGLTLFFCFMALSIIFQRGSITLRLSMLGRRNIVVTGLIVGLIGILAVNGGIIAYYRVNWNNNWIGYEWEPFTSKQIATTQWASGIDTFTTSPITQYPTGNESRILSLVRQWDYDSALVRMRNQIGVNWMTIPGPDIIYVGGHEYWVAPTSIRYPSDDWISRHLIYTHATGVFAIDSHSGRFVPIAEAFGLVDDPRIYYGEQFTETVYPRVKGFNEIENVSYTGSPDYVLSGWQRMLWFLAQGQIGFAFSPPQESIEMLHNRDVVKRVQKILIYGLKIDPDPYVVSHEDRVYYAVQVYTSYPLSSRFLASNYMRFFAVVLVDVENGQMQGYTIGKDDGFLVSFYRNYYSTWGPPPGWLVTQLRYPEALLGSVLFRIPGQLDTDFTYHVEDPYVWRSGSDFFERPPGTEVHYILLTEDNQARFVGSQLVEYRGSEGKNLAGLYIAQSGERLGQIQLLKATVSGNGSALIGPTAAVGAFTTNSEVKEKLTLFGANYKFGNILLYMIGQRLYYFIPVYITPTGTGGVITEMPFIGIVDASTRQVAIGLDSSAAYFQLTGGIPTQEPGDTERLRSLYQAFAGKGHPAQNVTGVYPDVYVQEGNLTYVRALDLAQIDQSITSFISNHVEVYNGQVYAWFVGSDTINFGVFQITSQGIRQLHYLSVKYR